MRFSKETKKKKSAEFKLAFVLVLSASLFLVIFLTVSNVRMFQRRADLNAQIREREEEISQLLEKIKDTKKEEDEDLSDYNLEKIIREQLLMKREGEEVVFITRSQAEISDDETEDEEEKFLWWNPLTWGQD